MKNTLGQVLSQFVTRREVKRDARWLFLWGVLWCLSFGNVSHALEQRVVSLTRNAQSSLTQGGVLSDDVYRYVERVEHYQENVCQTVQTPYQELERYQNLEQVCRWVNFNREVCHMERRCVPQCNPRDPRCNKPPICHEEKVCTLVPDRRWDCHNEWVWRERWVTRYRESQVCHLEPRTRVVTDKIFDHSYTVPVTVEFPAQATLQGGESETALVRLLGGEQTTDVEVTVDSPVFAYRVISKTRDASGAYRVLLGLVAKYEPSDLGEQMIERVAVSQNTQGKYELKFVDRAVVSRTTTQYEVQVTDLETGKVVFTKNLEVGFGAREILVPMTEVTLDSTHDLGVKLHVKREGMVISAPVDFTKEVVQVGQLNPSLYVDVNGVREFRIDGTGVGAKLKFVDQTPTDTKVETFYYIAIRRRVWGFLWRETLAEASFKRSDLTQEGNSVQSIALSAISGMSEKDLKEYVQRDSKIIVDVMVYRKSPRLSGYSPIQFRKESKLKL